VSFGVYFAIAGAVFLDAYPVPDFEFADLQLLAAVPLGLFTAAITALLVLFVRSVAMTRRPTRRCRCRYGARP
jgi:hypothetical protein